MLIIVAGYEDGNDADTLRHDPMFKRALDRLPSGNDRLEAVIVMVGIEQAKLLTAVHPVERIVDIEHDTLRHRPERAAVLVNQGPAEAQQRPPIGQIFQT